MSCIIDFDGTRFDFTQNRFKQKLLIKALIFHTQFDMSSLSKSLNVSFQTLIEVYQGEQFLSSSAAQNLGRLFLLAFSNPGRF